MDVLRILDSLAIASALVAAWFWFRASGSRLRRVSRKEELDASDINRMVVAVNRSQLLNARAAAATGVSALAVALRWATDLFGR